MKKPEPGKNLVPPLPGTTAEVPVRPLTDAQLAASRSSIPDGARPRPSFGVRSPGLSVPPPPRPPEEPSGPKLPPVIPPGGLPPTTPPPTSPKVDRNIRPRRLAILILLIIGFIGGIILAVWVFLRGSTTTPDITPIPSEDQNLFASPPASETPIGGDQDSDGDGLTDSTEAQLGTDLTRADTDGDGFTDKQELDAGYDPLGPGKLDTDRDGLSDPAEACWGTDPRTADTDGDGYLDGQEVANGYDPRIPSPNDRLTTEDPRHSCPS